MITSAEFEGYDRFVRNARLFETSPALATFCSNISSSTVMNEIFVTRASPIHKVLVLCGNAIELLSKEKHTGLIFTDPPYGQAGDYGRSQLGHRQVEGDDALDWLPAFAKESQRILLPDSACLVFGQWRTSSQFISAFQTENFRTRTVAIWDKKNSGLASHGFGEQYEQIYVFYKGQPKLDWFRGNIFEYPRLSGRPEHPTEKPLQLFIELMALFPSSTVLDPFLGTGTTLIAAEKLGRICTGIEVMPQYVDICLKRWQNGTGKQAVLEATGQTFDDVAKERLGQ